MNKGIFTLLISIACALLLQPSLVHGDYACWNCHTDTGKSSSFHAPVLKDCSVCHVDLVMSEYSHENTGNIEYGLSSEPPGLCYTCHDRNIFGADNSHSALPLSCLACHNPHKSNAPKLLVSPVSELCLKCHGRRPFEGTVVHKPVLDGNCLSCHALHGKSNIKLLASKEPDMCFTCHSRDKFRDESKHAPVVSEQCSLCHSSHSSNNPSRLAASLNFTCLKCHNALDNLGSQHSNIDFPIKKITCVGCHSPHSLSWGLRIKLQTLNTSSLHRNHTCNFCKKH